MLILEVIIRIPTDVDRVAVLGPSERNLKMVREGLGVRITAREKHVQVSGERGPVHAARNVVERLVHAAEKEEAMTRQRVLDLIAEESAVEEGGQAVAILNGESASAELNSGEKRDGRIAVYAGGRAVRAKTENQQHYLDAIRDHDLVFAIGPAGTGKTYLAVAAAVHMLKNSRVKKVILVRPAVEAGEKLGFLPGDLEEKVNPYLRPLFDALNDMMDFNTVRRFLDSDVVEVVPLAFMRGRTLNNAVIILDEAQNTTRGQMKMFLTRMGHGSKTIVTGDTTQIDLPDPRDSGLIDAARRLRRVKGVAFVALDRSDVVRHPLVQRVVDAYGEDDVTNVQLDAHQ